MLVSRRRVPLSGSFETTALPFNFQQIFDLNKEAE